MLKKVGLKHSSKSTKYELEGSYGDPVHEHFSFLKTAKLQRERNELAVAVKARASFGGLLLARYSAAFCLV